MLGLISLIINPGALSTITSLNNTDDPISIFQYPPKSLCVLSGVSYTYSPISTPVVSVNVPVGVNTPDVVLRYIINPFPSGYRYEIVPLPVPVSIISPTVGKLSARLTLKIISTLSAIICSPVKNAPSNPITVFSKGSLANKGLICETLYWSQFKFILLPTNTAAYSACVALNKK